MTLYRYTNTTQQQGANHANHIVAVKVDLVGSPIFTILDETQAAANGIFTLEWGDEASPPTENWAGRVMIGAVDDDGAVELDTVFHDWLAGAPVAASTDYKSIVTGVGALHLWEMDEVSGSWLDTIGTVDAAVTGTPTYQEDVPDQNSFGVLANNAHSRPATAMDITGNVVTIISMIKFDALADGVVWGLGDDVTNRIFLWHSNPDDAFGFGAGGGASLYGIGGAGAAIGDNKWHCIITEVTNSSYISSKMWIDGQPKTLSTQAGTPVNRTWNGKLGICASAYPAAGTKWPKHMHRMTYILGSITDDEAKQITMAAMSGSLDVGIPITSLIDSFSMDARNGGIITDLYSELGGTVATLAGSPTFPTADINQGIQLDGVDDSITIPNSATDYDFILNTGVFSISAKMKFNNHNDNKVHNLLTNGRSAATKTFGFFYDDLYFDRKLRLYMSPGTGAGNVTDLESAIGAITDNLSHHIIWWGDGVNAKIFLDDVEVATTAIAALSSGAMVGDAVVGILNTEKANCVVDQLRVYDVALSVAQRTALFNEVA